MKSKEKLKVGRPKLADKKLKNKALVLVIVSIIICLALIFGMYLNVFNTGKLKGFAKKDYVFYSQRDSRWKNTKFCGRSGKTISSSGCGVTAMSMVLANLYDSKITPKTTMKEAYKAGYCGTGINGTSSGYFKYAAKKRALNHYTYSKSSAGATKIKALLKKGGLVIVNVNSNSPFTSGGHYIVLYRVDDNGYVYVADPNKKSIGTKKYSLTSDFLKKNWIKGWWGISSKNTNIKGNNIKKVAKKNTKKKKTKKVSSKACTLSFSNIKKTTATYKISCKKKTVTVKSVSISLRGKIAKPSKNKKAKLLSGKMTNLKNNSTYVVKVKLSDGVTYKKKFTTKKASITETKLKKLPKGNCPVAPTVTLTKTGKVKISTNIGALTAAEKKNLYIVSKAYRTFNYKYTYGNGKTGYDKKYGEFKEPSIALITSKWTKNSKDANKYSKTYNTGDFYYTSIWSGGKKCYVNYFVKDGVTIDNATRKFILSRYNIITKDKIIRGTIAGTKAKSSDSKVFKIKKNLTKESFKATASNAKTGHEKAANKTATVTLTNSLGTGSFKLMLRNRYWQTSYLLNPLTGKNTKITSSSVYSGSYKKYGKAKHTKKSGKTVNGLELKTSANKKVYAMDSGTVSLIKTTSNSKNTGKTIYVTSTVNDHKYIHVYSNLKNISVKKGERVYKGQKIATTKKGFLYVTINFVNPDNNKSVGMLASNFIGQDKSYAIGSVSMAKVCRKLTNKCSSKFDPESSNSTNNSDTTKGVVTSSSTQASSIDDNSTGITTTNASNSDNNSNNANSTTTTNVNKSCSISYVDRKIGDIDCDGKVSDKDRTLLFRHAFNLYLKETNNTKIKISERAIITNSDTLKIANTNGDTMNDTKVDQSDYIKLGYFIAGKVSKICNNNGKCYSR